MTTVGHWSEALLCGCFEAAILAGLLLLDVFSVRSFFGGGALGAIMATAAGGWYVAGYVREFLPLGFVMGLAVAILVAFVLKRPILGVFLGAMTVLVSLQLAFRIAQTGALWEPPAMSAEYLRAMGAQVG